MYLTELENFYKDKRVLITGHTGFKGTWLVKILKMLGADVYGYSKGVPSTPSMYELLNVDKEIHSTIGDICDYEKLRSVFEEAQPECVLHLAAQSIVRESYRSPRETFATNVMGTVNLFECVRNTPSVKSVLNVTTDKVYENDDNKNHAFKEDEKLDGHDPYSNSKSCSELITHSYNQSFFTDNYPAVSTARASNVIGGGDFAIDRIIPDCVRAAVKDKKINIRNPYSIRPYQHVLEPLYVYLTIVMKQYADSELADCYNIGPDSENCLSTYQLVDLFIKYWGDELIRNDLSENNAPFEASHLNLDCSKMKNTFNWKPVWNINEALHHTVEWYKVWNQKGNLASITEQQIIRFLDKSKYKTHNI